MECMWESSELERARTGLYRFKEKPSTNIKNKYIISSSTANNKCNKTYSHTLKKRVLTIKKTCFYEMLTTNMRKLYKKPC